MLLRPGPPGPGPFMQTGDAHLFIPGANYATGAAVGIVFSGVDACAGAAREPSVAGCATPATCACGSPVGDVWALLAACAAIVEVARGVDANIAAADIRKRALETTHPRTNWHCVRRGAACGAALAAVGRVATGIHTRSAAIGLGAALGRTQPSLAHHPHAADRGTAAAVLRI